MSSHNGIERRISDRRHWDFFVEIGVNYFRTVGAAHAVTFLELNGISADVVARVTSLRRSRRKTKWEHHVNEAALRQALGARPLLVEHDLAANKC